MNGLLQNRIKPADRTAKTFDMNSARVKSANPPAKDSNDKKKTSFKNLITNSNTEVIRERSAKKNGDLSGAKTDEEFFQKLQEQTAHGKPRVPKNKLDKDAFLKLFVAQMQHQDPLNPDKGSEMAAQMAQFESVESMLNVNKTLEKMSKDQALGRATDLIDFVGKEVRLNNGKLKLEKGALTDAVFTTAKDVPNAELEVRDSAGVVVAKREIGHIKQGEHALEWDGKNADGKQVQDGIYTFAIIGKGMNDEEIPIEITSTVKVSGVDLQETGGSFFTELGKVRVGEVATVGSPGFVKKARGVEKSESKDPDPSVAPPDANVKGQTQAATEGQPTNDETGNGATDENRVRVNTELGSPPVAPKAPKATEAEAATAKPPTPVVQDSDAEAARPT